MLKLEAQTLRNKNYRKVLSTNSNIQLVLYSLRPGETIPKEKHKGSQFIYVVCGDLCVYTNDIDKLSAGCSMIVNPRTPHELRNEGDVLCNFYSIYSPPEHPSNALVKRQPK
jgi:quercetin dioxygenase-like cupin family protein